jgi:hypothetical protein
MRDKQLCANCIYYKMPNQLENRCNKFHLENFTPDYVQNDCTGYLYRYNDSCMNCKWLFETELTKVCDNTNSEYYQWDVDQNYMCERWRKE